MDPQRTYPEPSANRKSETLFLNVEGPRIDNLFGGVMVHEDGVVTIPNYYRKLQPTIQAYISQNEGFVRGATATKEELEALFNDIAIAEASAGESDRGCFEVFNRMVLSIGEHSDEIDPWINLIPNEYGLCVVKSAFALLLNRARAHTNKRQAIFDTFLEIRNIIGDASSKGIHFQTDPNVYQYAGGLYNAIVDAIEELLAYCRARKERKWNWGSKKKDQPRDPQSILRGVNEKAKALLIAVDNCRDSTIKKIGKETQQNLGESRFISWKVVEIKHLVSELRVDQTAQLSMFQEMQRTQQALQEMAQSKDEANLKLLQNLHEQWKKDQLTITKLESYIRQELTGQYQSENPVPRPKSSKAVISLERLFKILSTDSLNQSLSPKTSFERGVLWLQNHDLETILSTAERIDPISKNQAHSILNQDRFFDWMHMNHPDMLLVDGNIEQAAGNNVTPMSLFCANLYLTMMKLEPDSVFAQFYCGLHIDPHRNDWHGPEGMLRSLLVQILVALVDRDLLDLEFLDRRSYVQGLERNDPQTLSNLLHDLVQQFEADTTIYCLIDGLSVYDVDFRGLFPRLKVALQSIQRTVRDDELRSKLKVLMTVPFRSSRRLKELIEEDFYLSLPCQVLSPHTLSERSVSSSILRPSTASIDANQPTRALGTTDWGGEDYNNDEL